MQGLPLAVIPFVTPWLFAAGAACVSIPIVIHLLNRRRFRQRPWAAMQFLMAAWRRNVRRLKLQRLLLLLLRCLALLLLAAAIAQFIPGSAGLQALMGNSSRLTIIVWNNAYPMGYLPHGGESPFAKSRRLLKQWSQGLSGGEWVALISAARGTPTLLAKPVPASSAVTQIIAGQKVTQGGLNIPVALARAAGLAAKWHHRVGSVRVWFLTDDTASDFGCSAGSDPLMQAPQAVTQIRRAVRAILHAGATFRVFDLGRPHAANLAITHLRLAGPEALIGHNIHLRMTLLNAGSQPQPPIRIGFTIDGVSAGTQSVGTLSPQKSMTISTLLSNPIQTPGLHSIVAHIQPDALPIDDTRRHLFEVASAIPVLLVDGRPGDPAEGVLSSTAWLQAALAPAARGNQYAPHVIEMPQLLEENLSHFSVVVLSDVAPPGSRGIKRLEAFVRRGGTLLVYPGRQFDAAAWSHLPGSLLPARFGVAIASPAGKPATLDLQRTINAITEPFILAQREGLHTGIFHITIRKHIPLFPAPHSVTWLRLTGGDPLLVAGNFGRGKVALWGTSCDTQWTDMPAQPSFLPLVYELFQSLLPARGADRNLVVGRRLSLAVRGRAFSSLRGPDRTVLELRQRLVPGGEGRRIRLVSRPIQAVGIYRSADGLPFAAANVSASRDSNVAHVGPKMAAVCYKIPLRDIDFQPGSLAARVTSQAGMGGTAGWSLLFMALAMLIGEALAARAFSRYHLAPADKGAAA